MRYGLHSGPVTAGVLRGEKSRFQLFGDTVNFASRMESTGQRNKIQCSQATADLLIAGGKKHWVQPRDDLVNAKGKGVLQTYFIVIQRDINNIGSSPGAPSMKAPCISLKSKHGLGRSSHASSHSPGGRRGIHSDNSRRSLLMSQHESQIWTKDDELDDIEDNYDGFEDTNHQERLVQWNVEILSGLLRRIVAHRQTNGIETSDSDEAFVFNYENGKTALDEITEIIPLGIGSGVPNFEASCYLDIDPDTIVIPTKVQEQLQVNRKGVEVNNLPDKKTQLTSFPFFSLFSLCPTGFCQYDCMHVSRQFLS
jgi:hypothetical protein